MPVTSALFEPASIRVRAGYGIALPGYSGPSSIKQVMVEVFINQENFQLNESVTLADVLTLLQIHRHDGIAIAVNEDVIPRSEWERYKPKDRDKIFLIRATQGG